MKDPVVEELRALGYADPEKAAESIRCGLEQAAQGKGRVVSFAEYATDDEDGWTEENLSISDYHNELCNDSGCSCRGDL